MSRLMENKKGLILGVANENSISWGVAKVLAANGAELAFTYQNEINAFRRVERTDAPRCDAGRSRPYSIIFA
jgi:enoyl-[acyl-carrier-protein] reductase (NADH)